MTVLSGGNEDTSYLLYSNAEATYPSGDTNSFRSTLVRESIGVFCAGGVNPATGYAEHIIRAGAQSSFNFNIRWWPLLGSIVPYYVVQFTNGAEFIGFYDSSGVQRIAFIGGGNYGNFNVYKVNAAGTKTLLGQTSGTIAGGNLGAPLPFNVYMNYGTSGQLTIWYGGAQIFNYSGNIATDSATAIASVHLCASVYGSHDAWSEIVFFDGATSALGCAVCTETPYAGGNTQQFTGVGGGSGLVTNINPAAINDANYNYTGTAGQISEWQVNNAIPAGYTIAGLVIEARVEVGSSGPQNCALYLRVNSTDYSSGNISPSPLTSFGTASYIWQQNPHTGTQFLVSDIALASNAFNIGVAAET